MNWNLFYLINKEFLHMVALGAVYLIIVGSLIMTMRLLIDSLNKED